MTDQTGETNATEGLAVETLQAVVELQRTELNRLLREQSRLNDRIDSLLRLQEREQVLRQQMQASLERLALAQTESKMHRPALSAESSSDFEALRGRLQRTEDRFAALQGGVTDLIAYLERKLPRGDGPDDGSGSFVRVFAPT